MSSGRILQPSFHTSRRAFLTLAGATVAVMARAGRTAAAPANRGIPRTLARTATGGVVDAGFPIEYVGVRWPAGGTGGRIRFGGSGVFGPWQDIQAGCVAKAGDTEPSDTRSALVPADRATRCELDLPQGASAVALNCSDGPRFASPAAGGALADVDFLSRAAWGADESLRFDENGNELFPQTYWPVQTVTVHHTATGNDDPDPAARVRAIYRFHTIDEDFGDIGYHFLIDEAGLVYEGRWSGTDGTPGFDSAGRMVNAAHVGGFNAGNVGIALLGTFTDRSPTPAARQSLTNLLAEILGPRQIDPLGTVNYVNPISGATRTVAAIPGHRDWAATLCPGDVLAGELAAIRQDVADILDPAQ